MPVGNSSIYKKLNSSPAEDIKNEVIETSPELQEALDMIQQNSPVGIGGPVPRKNNSVKNIVDSKWGEQPLDDKYKKVKDPIDPIGMLEKQELEKNVAQNLLLKVFYNDGGEGVPFGMTTKQIAQLAKEASQYKDLTEMIQSKPMPTRLDIVTAKEAELSKYSSVDDNNQPLYPAEFEQWKQASDLKSALEQDKRINPERRAKEAYDLINAIKMRNISYRGEKLKRAIEGIGKENIENIINLTKHSEEIDASVEKNMAILEDENAEPELKKAAQQYIEEYAPSLKKEVEDQLVKYGDKVNLIKDVEDFENDYQSALEVKKQLVEKDIKLKEYFAQKEASYKNVSKSSGTLERTMDGLWQGIYTIPLNIAEQAGSESARDWLKGSKIDAENALELYGDEFWPEAAVVTGNAITIAALMYGGAKIPVVGRQLAAAEGKGGVLGHLSKLGVNSFVNPSSWAMMSSIYNETYKSTLDQHLSKGLNFEESHKLARQKGIQSAVIENISESIFPDSRFLSRAVSSAAANITGKTLTNAVAKKGGLSAIDYLKDIGKNISEEYGEEVFSEYANNVADRIQNVIAGKELYDTTLPTIADLGKLLLMTAVSTAVVSSPGTVMAEKRAIQELAQTPDLSIAAFQNMVDNNVRTQEEVQPYIDGILKYTKLGRMMPGATKAQIIQYEQLDQEEEIAKARLQESKGNTGAEAFYSSNLAEIQNKKTELFNETAIGIAKTELKKKLDADPTVQTNRTEVAKVKEEQSKKGVSENAQRAITLVESMQDRRDEKVKKNGVIATAITETSQSLENLNQEKINLETQLATAKAENNETQQKQIEPQLTQVNNEIQEKEKTLLGLKEVSPIAQEARGFTLEDENLDDNPAAPKTTQPSKEVVEKVKALNPEGFETNTKAMANDEYKELVSSYANEGLSTDEIMGNLQSEGVINENTTVKELKNFKQYVQGIKDVTKKAAKLAPSSTQNSKPENAKAPKDNREEASGITAKNQRMGKDEKKSIPKSGVNSQKTAVRKQRAKQNKRDSQIRKEAKEFFETYNESPTDDQINDYISTLVDNGDILPGDRKRIRSQIREKLGLNEKKEQQARELTLEDENLDDDETGTPKNEQKPEETEKQSDEVELPEVEEYVAQEVSLTDEEDMLEEERANAEAEAEFGFLSLENLGTLAKEKIIAFVSRNALANSYTEFNRVFSEIIGAKTQNYIKNYKAINDGEMPSPKNIAQNSMLSNEDIKRLQDIVIGNAITELNNRYGLDLNMSQLNENGLFNEVGKNADVYASLNKTISGIKMLQSVDENPREQLVEKSRRAISGNNTIEGKIKAAISKVAEKYGIVSIDNEGNLESAIEEMTDEIGALDELISMIADKGKNDKNTRVAESISKLVNVVFEQKKKANDYEINNNLAYAHAVVTALFKDKNGRTRSVADVIKYVNTRLTSTNYPVKNASQRLLYESVGEVLYALDETLYNSEVTDNVFEAASLSRSLSSVFSSNVLQQKAVAINLAGKLSIFTSNRSRIKNDLINEFEKTIDQIISSQLENGGNELFAVKNMLIRARQKKDKNLAETALKQFLGMTQNVKFRSAIEQTIGLSLTTPQISTSSVVEAIDLLQGLMTLNSGVNQSALYNTIAQRYIGLSEQEFGKYSESKYWSNRLKKNMSAIDKANRLTTLAKVIQAEAQGLRVSEDKTKSGFDTENNVVENSTNRFFGSGARKQRLAKNPLVALKHYAKNFSVQMLKEISITKGKIFAIDSEKFRKEHITLAKIAELYNSVMYGRDSYNLIEQVTDSPRVYMVQGIRLYKTGNGQFQMSNTSGVNENVLEGFFLQELQTMVDNAKKLNNASDTKLENYIPPFYKIVDGKVRLSMTGLKNESLAEFKNYMETIMLQYYNPAAAENPAKAEKAMKAIINETYEIFNNRDIKQGIAAFKQAVEVIKQNNEYEVTKGLSAFANQIEKEQIFNIKKATSKHTPKGHQTSVQDLFEEYVVMESFNRYYSAQVSRGDMEYYTGKDTENVFVRSKMFNSPGIPVNADQPFRYVVLGKNLFPWSKTESQNNQTPTTTSGVGATIDLKIPGTNKTVSISNDGLMFLSENANQTIVNAVGAEMGLVDQFKYAMSSVNTEGIPTAHKGMQVVLTKELAEANPILMNLYNFMQENNLDAIVDDSAEKIGAEKRMDALWTADNQFPELKEQNEFVHTANFGDIYIQLPINQPQAGRTATDPDQKNRQQVLYYTAKNQAVYNKAEQARAKRTAAAIAKSAIASGKFNQLINDYRKALADTTKQAGPLLEATKASIVEYLKNESAGQSSAVKDYYQSIINKINEGYNFEYDDGLLYNLQSSRFTSGMKAKMDALYMSLMSPLVRKNLPRYKIAEKEGFSEIVLPARFKDNLKEYADKNGEIYITAVKVPYNNAGTQFRAKIIFDKSLDKSGSVAIPPAEFYGLSNSDVDGDALFIFPMHPNPEDFLAPFEELGIDAKNMEIKDILQHPNIYSPTVGRFLFPYKKVQNLIDAYVKYQDNVAAQANAELFQTEYGARLQEQINDVSVFDRVTDEDGYTKRESNVLSAKGQRDRTENVRNSTGGIGNAASTINIINTFINIAEKVRVQFRPSYAKLMTFSLNNKEMDPAVFETAAFKGGIEQALSEIESKARATIMSGERKNPPTENEMSKAIQKEMDEFMSGFHIKNKMKLMNSTSQVLQLFVDAVKKGYLAKVGINQDNMSAFIYTAMRLGMEHSPDLAMRKAVNLINQPIVRKYFEMKKQNSMLKEEFGGYGEGILNSLKEDLTVRLSNALSIQENIVTSKVDLDKIQPSYSGAQIEDIDYVSSIALLNTDAEYAKAQVEALKAIETLETIDSSISALSLNRKKFENIPTNIDQARAFVAEMENIGMLATADEVDSVRRMINDGFTASQIREAMDHNRSGLSFSQKYYNNNFEAENNTIEIVRQMNEEIREAMQSENNPKTPLYSYYMSLGLTKEGVTNYLQLLQKIHVNEIITGNKHMLEDAEYLSKAEGFFMNSAFIGDSITAYKPSNSERVYNAIKSLISSRATRAFTTAVSKFQDVLNGTIMKDQIKKFTQALNEETEAELTYSLSKVLEQIMLNRKFLSKNAFITSLENRRYDETNPEPIKIENGIPVYDDNYYKKTGPIFSIVQAQPATTMPGNSAAFDSAIQDKKYFDAIEIAISMALENSEIPYNLMFDETDGRFFNSVTGVQYQNQGVVTVADNEFITGRELLSKIQAETQKQKALLSIAADMFNTQSAFFKSKNPDAYEWMQGFRNYFEAQDTTRLSPRHTPPTKTDVIIGKNGSTEFSQKEIADIREGIKTLNQSLSSIIYNENGEPVIYGNRPMTVRDAIISKLSSEKLDTSIVDDDVLNDPKTWVTYFADQISYSQSRNLLQLIDESEREVIQKNMNSRFEDLNDEFDDYAVRVVYNNPTITQAIAEDRLMEFEKGSGEFLNFAKKHEYIHTKNQEGIKLYKRVQMGVVMKGNKRVPNYVYTLVGVYEPNGEIIRTKANAGPKIDTLQQIVELPDVLFKDADGLWDFRQNVMDMLYGLSEFGTIDANKLLLDVQNKLDTIGDAWKSNGTFTTKNREDFFDTVIDVLEKNRSNTNGMYLKIGDQFDSTQIGKVITALKTIQDVSNQAMGDKVVLGYKEFSEVTNKEQAVEEKRYKGRLMAGPSRVDKKVFGNLKNLTALDIVRNLTRAFQGEKASVRGKTMKQFYDAYTSKDNNNKPENLSDFIDLFQSGINTRPYLLELAKMFKNNVGGIKTVMLSKEEFEKIQKKIRPGSATNGIAAAMYHDDVIYLNETMPSSYGPEMLMHEAMHALITDALSDTSNPEMQLALESFHKAIFTSSSAWLNNPAGSAQIKLASILNSKMPVYEQMDEIFAYTFSDSTGEMQKLLMSMESKDQSLAQYKGGNKGILGKIYDFVSGLLSKKHNFKKDNMFQLMSNFLEANEDMWKQEQLEILPGSSYDTVMYRGNEMQSVLSLTKGLFNNLGLQARRIGLYADLAKNNKGGMTAEHFQSIDMLIHDKNEHLLGDLKESFFSGKVYNPAAAKFSKDIPFASKTIKDVADEGIETVYNHYDALFSLTGEEVSEELSRGGFLSTALGLYGISPLVTVDQNGALNFNTASYSIAHKKNNESFAGNSRAVKEESAMTFAGFKNLNATEQREVANAAISAYIAEQQGYEVNNIRLAVAKIDETGGMVNYAFKMSDIRPYIKELLVEHSLNQQERLTTFAVTQAEFENSTHNNYSSYYLSKLANLPEFAELNNNLPGLNSQESINAYDLAKMQYDRIREFAKTGNFHELTTPDIAELMHIVRSFKVFNSTNDGVSQLMHGLSDILMMEYEKKTLEKNRDVTILKDPKDARGWKSAIALSLHQVASAYGVNKFKDEIAQEIDNGQRELKKFQEELDEKTTALLRSKGHWSNAITKKLVAYNIYPDYANRAFENLIDRTNTHATGESVAVKRLKTLTVAKHELGTGKMNQAEYDMLQFLHSFNNQHARYIYNNKGVSHGGLKDEAHQILDVEDDEQSFFVPYHPSSGMINRLNATSAKEAVLNAWYSIRGKGTIDDISISYKDNQGLLHKGTPKEIIRSLRAKELQANIGFKLTEKDVDDIYAIARKAKPENVQNYTPNDQTMSLPSIIRDKRKAPSEDLHAIYHKYMTEVIRAKVFNKTTGLYDAMELSAIMANKPEMAEFIKKDMSTRVLSKNYGNETRTTRKTLRGLMNVAKYTQLALNIPGATVDFVATTLTMAGSLRGVASDYDNRLARVISAAGVTNGAWAVGKLIYNFHTIRDIAIQTGMLQHKDYNQKESGLISDIKFGAMLPFWLSGNIPRLILVADSISQKDLSTLSDLKGNRFKQWANYSIGQRGSLDIFNLDESSSEALNGIKLRVDQGIDRVENKLGAFRSSTERVYMSNAVMSAAMQYMSWAPDFFNSRYGRAYEKNGIVYEGIYRTAYKQVMGMKTENMSPRQVQDSIQTIVHANTYAVVIGLLIKSMADRDDDEEKGLLSFLKRVFMQQLPVQLDSVEYKASKPFPVLSVITTIAQTIAYSITQSVQEKNSKAGPAKVKKAIISGSKLLPGSKIYREELLKEAAIRAGNHKYQRYLDKQNKKKNIAPPPNMGDGFDMGGMDMSGMGMDF